MNSVCILGLVEHCNRSIEDIMKKSMINQEDWVDLLSSVLFAIRTSRHSSTGFLPFRMLYQKDPIMPFEHADKLIHNDDEYDSDATEFYEPGASSGCTSGSGGITSGSGSAHGSDSECSDNILSTVQNLENQQKKKFDSTHQSIKKAQIHQAKGYNNRQAKGKPFEIGPHILKCNLQDQSHKCSLHKPFSRPYTVTGRSATGYFFHDRFSYQLVHSIPASQLVWFYENHLQN